MYIKSINIITQFCLYPDGAVTCKCGKKAIDLRGDKKYICSGITVPNGYPY